MKISLSKPLHITLWIAQITLAVFLLSGAIIKFLPIEKISPMMPWTGETELTRVRLLGLIDLAGTLGLLLPQLLKTKPQLTAWTAILILILMLCAIVFHLCRNEAKVIGFNIFLLFLAAFIAWGRFKINRRN